MKNILFFIGVIIATALIITSCQKEKIETVNPATNVSSEKSLESGIPLISNPKPIANYFTNAQDADDERISRQLYEIALIARPLFKDNTFNQYIINNAMLRDNSCVDLRIFTALSELRNLTLDKTAFDSFKDKVNNTTLTHRSTNPDENGKIEEYIPAIFVANIKNADYTKQPFFSSGTYVNNQLSGAEAYQDYIVVWYADENGNFQEILMNEETAMKTTHPIFIIDNAEEAITHRPKSTTIYQNPSGLKNTSTAWYSSYEYQINYRYDNTNHSEFCITGAHIGENGEQWLICKKDDGTYASWKKIAEVHKNNVGQLLNHWEQFCDGDLTPYETNYVFWNTYERDWAKSEKDLGQATRNSKTIILNGRRTYTSEWYSYDPSQLTNNPADINYIYWNWAKWHDNSKGKFRIWRIQP